MTVRHQPTKTEEGTVTRAVVWKLMILLAAMIGIPAYAQLNNEYTAAGGAWHLYRKNCSGCHGFQGQGLPPVGNALMANPFVTDSRAEAIKQVIRNGRRGKDKVKGEYLVDHDGLMSMPPFPQSVISDRELDLLVSYLKAGFQKGEFNKR